MRLIDADKLKPDTKTFTSAYSEELKEFYSQEAIDNAPTIEAEPVRHGKWRTGNRAPAPIDRFVCSVCDGLVVVSTFRNRCMYNYCPNCGAKMDGGDSS